MADSCCEGKSDELVGLREKQARVLWIVLAVNAVLFVAEFVVGWAAHSTALLADSLISTTDVTHWHAQRNTLNQAFLPTTALAPVFDKSVARAAAAERTRFTSEVHD